MASSLWSFLSGSRTNLSNVHRVEYSTNQHRAKSVTPSMGQYRSRNSLDDSSDESGHSTDSIELTSSHHVKSQSQSRNCDRNCPEPLNSRRVPQTNQCKFSGVSSTSASTLKFSGCDDVDQYNTSDTQFRPIKDTDCCESRLSSSYIFNDHHITDHHHQHYSPEYIVPQSLHIVDHSGTTKSLSQLTLLDLNGNYCTLSSLNLNPNTTTTKPQLPKRSISACNTFHTVKKPSLAPSTHPLLSPCDLNEKQTTMSLIKKLKKRFSSSKSEDNQKAVYSISDSSVTLAQLPSIYDRDVINVQVEVSTSPSVGAPLGPLIRGFEYGFNTKEQDGLRSTLSLLTEMDEQFKAMITADYFKGAQVEKLSEQQLASLVKNTFNLEKAQLWVRVKINARDISGQDYYFLVNDYQEMDFLGMEELKLQVLKPYYNANAVASGVGTVPNFTLSGEPGELAFKLDGELEEKLRPFKEIYIGPERRYHMVAKLYQVLKLHKLELMESAFVLKYVQDKDFLGAHSGPDTSQQLPSLQVTSPSPVSMPDSTTEEPSVISGNDDEASEVEVRPSGDLMRETDSARQLGSPTTLSGSIFAMFPCNGKACVDVNCPNYNRSSHFEFSSGASSSGDGEAEGPIDLSGQVEETPSASSAKPTCSSSVLKKFPNVKGMKSAYGRKRSSKAAKGSLHSLTECENEAADCATSASGATSGDSVDSGDGTTQSGGGNMLQEAERPKKKSSSISHIFSRRSTSSATSTSTSSSLKTDRKELSKSTSGLSVPSSTNRPSTSSSISSTNQSSESINGGVRALFGNELHLARGSEFTGLPFAIGCLLQAMLRKECRSAEGVFRKSGNVKLGRVIENILEQLHLYSVDHNIEQDKAKRLIAQLNGDEFSVYDLASILKKYISELPGGLLSIVQYPELAYVSAELARVRTLPPEADVFTIVQSSIATIRNILGLDRPRTAAIEDNPRIVLLHYLVSLMYQISCIPANQSSNRMDAHNMAVCIGPSILGAGPPEPSPASSYSSGKHGRSKSSKAHKDSSLANFRHLSKSISDSLSKSAESVKSFFGGHSHEAKSQPPSSSSSGSNNHLSVSSDRAHNQSVQSLNSVGSPLPPARPPKRQPRGKRGNSGGDVVPLAALNIQDIMSFSTLIKFMIEHCNAIFATDDPIDGILPSDLIDNVLQVADLAPGNTDDEDHQNELDGNREKFVQPQADESEFDDDVFYKDVGDVDLDMTDGADRIVRDVKLQVAKLDAAYEAKSPIDNRVKAVETEIVHEINSRIGGATLARRGKFASSRRDKYRQQEQLESSRNQVEHKPTEEVQPETDLQPKLKLSRSVSMQHFPVLHSLYLANSDPALGELNPIQMPRVNQTTRNLIRQPNVDSDADQAATGPSTPPPDYEDTSDTEEGTHSKLFTAALGDTGAERKNYYKSGGTMKKLKKLKSKVVDESSSSSRSSLSRSGELISSSLKQLGKLLVPKKPKDRSKSPDPPAQPHSNEDLYQPGTSGLQAHNRDGPSSTSTDDRTLGRDASYECEVFEGNESRSSADYLEAGQPSPGQFQTMSPFIVTNRPQSQAELSQDSFSVRSDHGSQMYRSTSSSGTCYPASSIMSLNSGNTPPVDPFNRSTPSSSVDLDPNRPPPFHSRLDGRRNAIYLEHPFHPTVMLPPLDLVVHRPLLVNASTQTQPHEQTPAAEEDDELESTNL